MKQITVDLTRLRSLSGRLIRDKQYELLLVEHYKMVTDNTKNTFLDVRKIITADIFQDPNRTSYSDFTTIMDSKHYQTVMHRFHSLLEHILFKQLTSDIVDVEFDSVIKNTPKEYIVKFNLKEKKDFQEDKKK